LAQHDHFSLRIHLGHGRRVGHRRWPGKAGASNFFFCDFVGHFIFSRRFLIFTRAGIVVAIPNPRRGRAGCSERNSGERGKFQKSPA
jgi:hypothetical protein